MTVRISSPPPLGDSNFGILHSMKFFNKVCASGKTQLQNPETRLGIGLMVGIFFGIAVDNVGLGIVLGVVFGASDYAARKKKNKKEDIVKNNKNIQD